MMYEFQEVAGTRVVERFYSMAQAPDIGEIVLIEGMPFRRIISSPQVDVKVFDHVAINLPKWCKGAPHYTDNGCPAFQSQREVQEFAKREGMRWD